jgi:hypothetical protein
MITCVLIDDAYAARPIVEFETTEVPVAGDTVGVADWSGKEPEVTVWRVLPVVRAWRVLINEKGGTRMTGVFVRCTKELA